MAGASSANLASYDWPTSFEGIICQPRTDYRSFYSLPDPLSIRRLSLSVPPRLKRVRVRWLGNGYKGEVSIDSKRIVELCNEAEICDYCLLRNLVTLGATVCRRSSGRESRGRKLAFRCCPSPESCAIKDIINRYWLNLLSFTKREKFYLLLLLDYGVV